MGNLLASLITTAGAMRAYDHSLSNIQNNVANAESPGYVQQRVTFVPRQFDLKQGLVGGVDVGKIVSYRDSYSERNVWRQSQQFGQSSQQTADLEQIEPFFPIGKDQGIPGAMTRFFNAVSSLSVNPNDPVGRQVVLDRAESVARAFNSNAEAIGNTANSADRELRSTVDQINEIASRIRGFNEERRSDKRKLDDPALDAHMYAALEELSSLVDFNTVDSPDGSLQVLIGGQTPIVIGDQLHPLQVDFSEPQPRILNDAGVDITSQIGGGSLKGLLDTRNQLIPSYMDDLNRLAATFADRVNQVLAGGLDANGSSPTKDLFTYDPLLGTAATFAVTDLRPDEFAAADSTAPLGNGNALRLTQLSDSNEMDSVTFGEFYGNIGARVGRDLKRVQENKSIQQELVNQGRQLRQDRSGVSLDEEAARLVEAQRAYQANAQLFQILNGLTETLLSILR